MSFGKNRLRPLLQRHHLTPPEGNPFAIDQVDWWLALPIGKLEKINPQSDLDTQQFAEAQVARLDSMMNEIAAKEEQVARLIHLPGFGVITAVTVWAAIGDIQRFADSKHLVGYAGLGARIHDSGLTTRTGKITKAGRRDLRVALVEAAQVAAAFHPHWKAELARLEGHLGRNKAIVAIARKLLVGVWYLLAKQATDRFADPGLVARKWLNIAYSSGKSSRPANQSAAQFVRQQLDALQIGADLSAIPRGQKKKPIRLPPSSLSSS